jgi:hypothetical protein
LIVDLTTKIRRGKGVAGAQEANSGTMARKQGTSPVFVDFDIPGIIGHGKCTGRETRAR